MFIKNIYLIIVLMESYQDCDDFDLLNDILKNYRKDIDTINVSDVINGVDAVNDGGDVHSLNDKNDKDAESNFEKENTTTSEEAQTTKLNTKTFLLSLPLPKESSRRTVTSLTLRRLKSLKKKNIQNKLLVTYSNGSICSINFSSCTATIKQETISNNFFGGGAPRTNNAIESDDFIVLNSPTTVIQPTFSSAHDSLYMVGATNTATPTALSVMKRDEIIINRLPNAASLKHPLIGAAFVSTDVFVTISQEPIWRLWKLRSRSMIAEHPLPCRALHCYSYDDEVFLCLEKKEILKCSLDGSISEKLNVLGGSGRGDIEAFRGWKNMLMLRFDDSVTVYSTCLQELLTIKTAPIGEHVYNPIAIVGEDDDYGGGDGNNNIMMAIATNRRDNNSLSVWSGGSFIVKDEEFPSPITALEFLAPNMLSMGFGDGSVRVLCVFDGGLLKATTPTTTTIDALDNNEKMLLSIAKTKDQQQQTPLPPPPDSEILTYTEAYELQNPKTKKSKKIRVPDPSSSLVIRSGTRGQLGTNPTQRIMKDFIGK